jgi:glycosyltransferase involved in cell wall biosynthesis
MPITIGIPFYNAEAYLADAIRSIIAQTYQDWELILVDDGSTDRSLEIARSVHDSRIRLIADGKNRRLPYRLNQITCEAKYDLIGRMDADDLISPTRFEKQAVFLNIHPDIDLVTAGACSLTNDSRPAGIRYNMCNEPITGRNLLLGRCGIIHAAILGRKSWFLRNPYDLAANLCEDYELWLRAFSKNDLRIHRLNEILYYYREEDSVTIKKILTAYKYGPYLLRKYGYLGLSRFEILMMVAKVHGKSIVVRGLDFLHRTDLLLKNRNAPITDESLLRQFYQEIDLILKTNLPL